MHQVSGWLFPVSPGQTLQPWKRIQKTKTGENMLQTTKSLRQRNCSDWPIQTAKHAVTINLSHRKAVEIVGNGWRLCQQFFGLPKPAMCIFARQVAQNTQRHFEHLPQVACFTRCSVAICHRLVVCRPGSVGSLWVFLWGVAPNSGLQSPKIFWFQCQRFRWPPWVKRLPGTSGKVQICTISGERRPLTCHWVVCRLTPVCRGWKLRELLSSSDTVLKTGSHAEPKQRLFLHLEQLAV